jgi:hypothetical protein
MSIAEKLETIATNEVKVYEKGLETGKQEQTLAFYNAISLNGQRRDFDYAFRGANFDEIADLGEGNMIVPSYSAIYMFSKYKGMKIPTWVRWDLINRSKSHHLFYNMPYLEEFPDIGLPALEDYTDCWSYCYKLKKIEMIRVNQYSKGLNKAFTYTNNLTYFDFEGEIKCNINIQHCTKLSIDALRNLVSNLYDFSCTSEEFTRSIVMSDDTIRKLGDTPYLIDDILSRCWNIV